MKVCGIVTEYNPFHNGHLYHIEKAREKTRADVLVVAMSGNFLQRGEPSIVDKWDRASLALNHGADIVVEIPAAFSVQPADIFAKGSIELLMQLGMDVLCFGSESGTGSDYIQAATLYLEKTDDINTLFQREQKQEYTYAKNMGNILSEYFPEIKLDLTQPNNMLGFAYARMIVGSRRPVGIETIKRKNSHYHDADVVRNEEIASATAIRNMLFSDNNWQNYDQLPFPEDTEEILRKSKLVQWDDYFSYLKYRILTMSLPELSRIYLMEKGQEYRVKETIKQSVDMQDFVSRLKTKQLSWTRLQRLCYYILLDQSKENMDKMTEELEYIRVLGFNRTGQEHLNRIKHQITKPLITNINRKNNELLAYDIMVGEVYRLADENKIRSQDYMRKPLKIH